jgi:glycosyltransferase involved in cell wall biosynthesis
LSEVDVVVADVSRATWVHAARGFERAGYSTLTVEPLRRAPAIGERHGSVAAAAALQARRVLPATLGEWAMLFSYRAVGRAARRCCRRGRAFWGASGASLEALAECRRNGVPALLDCGSSHMGWQERRLRQEVAIDARACQTSRPQRLLDRRVAEEYGLSEEIAVPSRFAAATMVEFGVPQTTLRLNPYGADLDFWRPPNERPNPPATPLRIVFTGTLMLRKGLRYLFEAWRAVEPRGAELWLAGNPRRDAAALLAPPPAVRLLGWRTQEELREIYRGAHLFVLPSLEEGMARAVLEAMAAGLPVLVTPETGAGDVMVDGEDGWLVPSADAGALAERLAYALAHPQRLAPMGESARRRVAGFSWDAYGDRCAAFLASLIGPPRVPRVPGPTI